MSDHGRLEEKEGFICPFCLVSFATVVTLSAHFLRFHEEQSDSQAVSSPLIRVEEDCHITPSNTGHCFKSCMVARPLPCQHCREIIWQNGLMCQRCNQMVHEQCLPDVSGKCQGRPAQEEPTRKPFSRGGGGPQGGGAQNGPSPRVSHSKVKVKHLVSKGRERFVDEEFDLDLTYITDKIIAMSFPASGLETTYRNDLKDVAKMLERRHNKNYMVFNLSERSYDTSKFNNQVLDFGWPDHLAPSLERLSSVCKSMKSWLDSDPQHVAVVHCKGGKGRTGCVIAAFMHYTEVCHSAQDALDHFAMKRFTGKQPEGVKQPSQKRYVFYFSDLLKGRAVLDTPPLLLRHLIIHGVPDFDGRGGCRPFVKVYEDLTLMATSGLYVCGAGSERVKMSFYDGVKLKGEILIKCFHKKQHSSSMELIFRVQFHTSFVKDHEMVFAKEELDEAHRDKRFPDSAKLDLIFTPVMPEKDLTDAPVANIRHSLLDGHEGRLFSGPEQLSRSDSYQNFREVDGLLQSLRQQTSPRDQPGEDLIDLSSPSSPRGPLARDIQRVPGPADASLYTVVDHLVKDNSSRKSPPLRPLPTPPSSVEEEMAMSEEIRQTFKQMSSQPSQRLPSYSYVEPDVGVAVNVDAGSEWGEVRLPTGAGRRDEPSALPSAPPSEQPDYFNLSAINDGQNFVASQPVNRESIIEITRPSSSKPSPQAAVVDPRDYANVKQEDSDLPRGQPPLQEDYVNSNHELLMAHNDCPSPDNGQMDYINSAVVDQTLDRRAEHRVEDGAGRDSPEESSAAPIEDRDYINSTDLDLSEEPEATNGAESEEQEPPAAQNRGVQVKRGFSSITHAIKSKLHLKEKGPAMVQSQAINAGDKTQSLSGFSLSVPLERIQQKGEDYFFVKNTWGDPLETPEVALPTTTPPPLPPARGSPNVARKHVPPAQHGQNKPLPQPKPHQPKTQPQAPSPVNPMSNMPLPPLPTSNKPRSSAHPSKPAANSAAMSGKQSPPSRQPPHKPLPYRSTKPAVPPSTPLVEELRKKQSLSRHSSVPINCKTSNGQSSGKIVPRRDVEDRRSFWYKESLSRDAAISMMRQSAPGSFIVRDSSTVAGGYALTIRVSEDTVRSKLKLPTDIIITEDMCVKHFLVQPDSKGVRLQGWSEPPFDDLVEFIRHHCIERYCLPTVLVLPNSDLGSGSVPPESQVARPLPRPQQDQAATDLIYLGMVDVSGPGVPDTIASVADQLKSLALTKANVVNFKASKDGLTVTDTVSGSFVKRFHPLNTISCCTVDPTDTRWDFEDLQYKGKAVTVKRAKCFGFVWKPGERSGYMCALFGELEPSQPVGAIVHFVNKLLANYKS